MRKWMVLIAVLATPTFANGPKYAQKDPLLQDEFENVYKDQANTFKRTISSGTFTNLTVVTKATIPNGTVATDAVAFGQISGTRILQIVTCSASPSDATTSASFTDTSTSCSVTPTNSSTKFIIFAEGLGETGNAGTTNAYYTINGTTTGNLGDSSNGLGHVVGQINVIFNFITMVATDTPGTSSTQTYKVRYVSVGGATVQWGFGLRTQIVIIEVG